MATVRGDVGGAFMRPWFIARVVSTAINGVIHSRAGIGQGVMNDVIQSRADVDQGRINAPLGCSGRSEAE